MLLPEVEALAEFPSGYARWIREELEKPHNRRTKQFDSMADILWALIDGKEDNDSEDIEMEEEYF